jgi:hypothetical protein
MKIEYDAAHDLLARPDVARRFEPLEPAGTTSWRAAANVFLRSELSARRFCPPFGRLASLGYIVKRSVGEVYSW